MQLKITSPLDHGYVRPQNDVRIHTANQTPNSLVWILDKYSGQPTAWPQGPCDAHGSDFECKQVLFGSKTGDSGSRFQIYAIAIKPQDEKKYEERRHHGFVMGAYPSELVAISAPVYVTRLKPTQP
jgi:hypothetical protein